MNAQNMRRVKTTLDFFTQIILLVWWRYPSKYIQCTTYILQEWMSSTTLILTITYWHSVNMSLFFTYPTQ